MISISDKMMDEMYFLSSRILDHSCGGGGGQNKVK